MGRLPLATDTTRSMRTLRAGCLPASLVAGWVVHRSSGCNSMRAVAAQSRHGQRSEVPSRSPAQCQGSRAAGQLCSAVCAHAARPAHRSLPGSCCRSQVAHMPLHIVQALSAGLCLSVGAWPTTLLCALQARQPGLARRHRCRQQARRSCAGCCGALRLPRLPACRLPPAHAHQFLLPHQGTLVPRLTHLSETTLPDRRRLVSPQLQVSMACLSSQPLPHPYC